MIEGKIYFDDKELNFLYLMDGKREYFFANIDGTIFSLNYFLEKNIYLPFFAYLYEYVNRGLLKKNISVFLDSAENYYYSVYNELVVELKYQKNLVDTKIAKITELEINYDDENDMFRVIAIIGIKNFELGSFDEKNTYSFDFRVAKVLLGYYENDFDDLLDLLGTYYIFNDSVESVLLHTNKEDSGNNTNCMICKKQDTIDNFVNTGLFGYSNGKIYNISQREYFFKTKKDILKKYISEKMIVELLEKC